MSGARVLAQRPPVRDAKGKLIAYGFTVSLAPLPAARRDQFLDGLLGMAVAERKRREGGAS